MKKLLALFAVAMIAIGANAQKLIAENDFTGGFEGDYPYWYGGGSVSSDADGIAITVKSQKELMWLMTFPWNSLWLKKSGNYKVVVTAKFPSDGTLMAFFEGPEECASSIYVTATREFQEVEIVFPPFSDWFFEDFCNLMLHFNDFTGTTILKKVQLFEIEDASATIDDITYCFDKNSKTAAVAKVRENCKKADIPAIICHEGEKYTVTKMMYHCFNECPYVTAVTIPNTVTEICQYAFAGCLGIEEITIPASVKVICQGAFEGCWRLRQVIALAETPPVVYEKSFLIDCNADPSKGYNITLIVQEDSRDIYMNTEPWNKFNIIETLIGENKKKCAEPTISYKNGKLTFNCETEGAVCRSTITNTDIASYIGDEVQLGVTYQISVFATKSGYNKSDTVTATLCWIDVDQMARGVENAIANIPANAVLIQGNGSSFNISGLDAGTAINVYDTAGRLVGSAKASAGATTIDTPLHRGEIGIVKIGEKAVKVLVQ